MSKIRNRFNSKEILTCHDNLLTTLYQMGLHNITYREINGRNYLINSIEDDKFTIELRAKIEKTVVETYKLEPDMPLLNIYNEQKREYQEIIILINAYLNYLTFTNDEKLIMNILLDKYLNSNEKYGVSISFREIEGIYRKRAISYRNIILNDFTYRKYVSTIEGLMNKQLYLKTSKDFRQIRYGVNDKEILQRLLIVDKPHLLGKNNVEFEFNFGGFGRILKLSRRYSNTLPNYFYAVSFKQVKMHIVAFYIAREVFIQQGKLNKNPYKSDNKRFKINPRDYVDLLTESTLNKRTNNHLRNLRMVAGYIEKVLDEMKNKGIISNYNAIYDYNETEKFQKKHEFDYDINSNLCCRFTTNSLSENVSVVFEVVMLTT